jgi:RNA polymerase sigma factor (sigma-70 family)
VQKAHSHYPECPEALMVTLARGGDRNAFQELVSRRQSSIRSLMRRCSGDITLADDLAQQVFLQVWLKIHTLKDVNAFGGWLKRLAISIWLQHQRKNDALRQAEELSDMDAARADPTGIGMDLEQALATLAPTVRLCVVLSYSEGLSHSEIAESVDMPLGTVKSHIQRGVQKLRQVLSAYQDNPDYLDNPDRENP